MYIHLGADTLVRESTVVGIFDLDNTSCSKITREFLNKAEREGRTFYVVSEDLPKAYVLCAERGADKVYLTQLAAGTLAKRAADENFI